MQYLNVLGKTLFFYVIITIAYRIMGKREIGELSIMDLIVSILIAELVAISIDNYDESIFITLLPITLLVIIQVSLSKISFKKNKVRDVLEGKPSIIISRGKVNFKEMDKQRYNIDNLLTELRGKAIKSIEDVDYAILETSGKLSVFEKEKDKSGSYPLPIILDGQLQEEVLRQIKKSKSWLEERLDEEGLEIEEVFYAFYRSKQLYLIKENSVN